MPFKLFLKVTPGAKREGFFGIWEDDGKKYLKLSISSPAIDGRANEAVVRFVAEYFNIAKARISITSGLTAKYKTIMIVSGDERINQEIQRLFDDDSDRR